MLVRIFEHTRNDAQKEFFECGVFCTPSFLFNIMIEITVPLFFSRVIFSLLSVHKRYTESIDWQFGGVGPHTRPINQAKYRQMCSSPFSLFYF
jgi:hypothetical protein